MYRTGMIIVCAAILLMGLATFWPEQDAKGFADVLPEIAGLRGRQYHFPVAPCHNCCMDEHRCVTKNCDQQRNCSSDGHCVYYCLGGASDPRPLCQALHPNDECNVSIEEDKCEGGFFTYGTCNEVTHTCFGGTESEELTCYMCDCNL